MRWKRWLLPAKQRRTVFYPKRFRKTSEFSHFPTRDKLFRMKRLAVFALGSILVLAGQGCIGGKTKAIQPVGNPGPRVERQELPPPEPPPNIPPPTPIQPQSATE